MNNNSSKQVLLSVIGVAILVVAVVGVSFAFFNYSRTGTEVNGLTTGNINFTGNVQAVELSNAFPVSAAAVTNGTATAPDVATAVVTISGSTTYANGIDFTITAVPSATNDISSKYLTTQVTTAGLDDVEDFVGAIKFAETGNTVLASGHIPANTTVTDGTITIKMFFDIAKVLITDTEEEQPTIDYANGRDMISTTDWNNKTYSFTVNIWAVQGTAA